MFDARKDRLEPDLDGPCLCGSEATLRACCWNGREILPKPAQIRERLRVRYRNPRCYASARWNCSSKISGEHYLSRSVLSAFVGGRKAVSVSGHRWQKEKVQSIGISSLAAKVLCTEHNTALSPIDTLMARALTHLIGMDAVLQSPDPNALAVHCVNGHDLERWLLKAYIGAMRAKEWPDLGGGPLWTPPERLLRVLYDGRLLGNGHGLRVTAPPPGVRTPVPVPGTNSLYLRPLSGAAELGKPSGYGCSLWMYGLTLNLVVPAAQDEKKVLVGDPGTMTYRPTELRWINENRFVSLLLCWHPNSGSERMALTVVRRFEDDRD
jgi:hypothetical protein